MQAMKTTIELGSLFRKSFFLLLGLTVSLIPIATANARPGDEECKFTTVVHYELPLGEMRPIHHPPYPSEQIPFAPRGVEIRVPVPTELVGQSQIGLELTRSTSRAVNLDWTVVSRLSRVNRKGAVIKKMDASRRHVGRLEAGVRFLFTVSGRPAIYRVDSAIFDASGRRLGKYAEYFRVLVHRTEFRESVSPRFIHGGEVLVTKTENRGTTGLSFGMSLAVDRFQEGGWQRDPITPKGFPGVNFFIFGGVSYECYWLRLPNDMTAGHYRVRKDVEVSGGREHTIGADFFVVAE